MSFDLFMDRVLYKAERFLCSWRSRRSKARSDKIHRATEPDWSLLDRALGPEPDWDELQKAYNESRSSS